MEGSQDSNLEKLEESQHFGGFLIENSQSSTNPQGGPFSYNPFWQIIYYLVSNFDLIEAFHIFWGEKLVYCQANVKSHLLLMGEDAPHNKRGSLPIFQVPIRLMNVWCGMTDGIVDPFPFQRL